MKIRGYSGELTIKTLEPYYMKEVSGPLNSGFYGFSAWGATASNELFWLEEAWCCVNIEF